jgi:hypothetical protein
MKPKYVVPCVCIDHEPDVRDSVHFGMPRLDVVQSNYPSEQFWFVSCPVCGRGGIIQYKTAHEGLKQWNILQSYCWHGEIFGLDSTKTKRGVPEWKVRLYNKFFKEEEE